MWLILRSAKPAVLLKCVPVLRYILSLRFRDTASPGAINKNRIALERFSSYRSKLELLHNLQNILIEIKN